VREIINRFRYIYGIYRKPTKVLRTLVTSIAPHGGGDESHTGYAGEGGKADCPPQPISIGFSVLRQVILCKFLNVEFQFPFSPLSLMLTNTGIR